MDPIDGTEWFSRGEDNFSILAILLDDSRAIWSAGIFPKTDTLFIGSESDLSIETGNKISRKFEPVFIGKKPKTIAAHYRLGRGSFRKGYDALTAGGFKILMNGDGFGTNLSALEKFLQGEISAFIAAKMSIVDGFPIAHLIKSAGGLLRFFDPREDIDIWTPVKEWAFHDFGVNGGKRTRFIVANSEKLMEEIIATLNKQIIRNSPL